MGAPKKSVHSSSSKRIDDLVVKLAEHAEDFEMNCTVEEGRVPGRLADDIRHLIEGKRVAVIEQRTAHYAGLGEGGADGSERVDDCPAERKHRGSAAESRRRIFG